MGKFVLAVISVSLAWAWVGPAGPAFALERSAIAIKKNDKNGDGRVSRKEWRKPKSIFDEIDLDGDGFLTRQEFQTRFGETPAAAAAPAAAAPAAAETPAAASAAAPAPAAASGKVLISMKDLDDVTKAAFLGKFRKREHELARGMVESRLIPVYPANASCSSIDHIFGEPWRGPVPNKWHSGADIPASWDQEIYAMADGEVVARFDGSGKGFRGIQVVLRHRPEDTGLPVWIYTLYSHFSSEPKLKLGQRVAMGEYLGPNGKTGVPGKKREPHLHLTVTYSEKPEYARFKGLLVPSYGHFIDPVALFRGGMPLDTHAMRALPDSQKKVAIAYKLTTGEIVPPNARIIWHFACRPN